MFTIYEGTPWQQAVVVVPPDLPSPSLNRMQQFREDLLSQLRVIERALRNIFDIVSDFFGTASD